MQPSNSQSTKKKALLVLFTILVIAVIYYTVKDLPDFNQQENIQQTIDQLGAYGPLFIIALIAIAVVISPIPSAPIALAAGAAYGHSWGTLYVLLGAELGAIIAFLIARLLGKDILLHWLGEKLSTGLLGSQTSLSLIVFFSRLMPFISFDIISYTAGLSILSFWRFALATLAGIAPASFLLAHFGSEMASSESDRVLYAVLLLGLIAGGTWLFGPLLKRWFNNKK